ncbi:unnamed protein product [Caenorhabditis auriculariae]|uniref:MSP domain-containing protein n=1 Tax=Caenorhabditis auriculariae TaxID=2777116 RepID=A0A8S1HXG1_9PELO|nr:unnamed protein product [Caenorhabditis auriculariae]
MERLTRLVKRRNGVNPFPPGDGIQDAQHRSSFNALYDDVINSSARCIGYGIKTTNMKRLGVDPPCGVPTLKEAVLLAVSCDAFAYGQEDHEQRPHHDRVDQHARRRRQAVPT